jgi:hypothetical protein
LLETWEAQRLERIIRSGRTRPLVIECSRSEPVGDEEIPISKDMAEGRLCVVKGFNLPEITNFGLFSEVFGNLLARSLGIDTPAPCLVHLSIPFVDAAKTVLKRERLTLIPGIASGCEYFSGGYSNVTPTTLSPEELEQATRIYGFDLLVQNPDRTIARPNCAMHGGRMKLFDFETAFSFVLLIGTQNRPWEVSKHRLGPTHLFHSELLRRKTDLDWKPFISRVAAITGRDLDEMLEGLPTDWLQHAARVRAHLLEVAKNAHRFELELQRSLL